MLYCWTTNFVHSSSGSPFADKRQIACGFNLLLGVPIPLQLWDKLCKSNYKKIVRAHKWTRPELAENKGTRKNKQTAVSIHLIESVHQITTCDAFHSVYIVGGILAKNIKFASYSQLKPLSSMGIFALYEPRNNMYGLSTYPDHFR